MFKAFTSAIFATVAVAQNQDDMLMSTSSAYINNMQQANDLMIMPQQAPTMKKEDVEEAIKEAVEEAVIPQLPAKDIEDAVSNGIVKATE